MTEVINMVLQPDQLDKLMRAFMLLKKGALKEVNIEAPEQHTTVRILKAPDIKL